MTFLEDLERIQQFRERFKNSDLYEIEDHVLWAILKASKYDMEKAEKLMITIVDTRSKFINERRINFNDYTPVREISESIPYKLLGFDTRDRPVMWVGLGGFNANEFIKKGLRDDLLKYFCKVADDLCKETFNQSVRVGKHVKATYLIDTKDLSVTKFFNWELYRLTTGLVKDVEPLIRLCNAAYVVNCSWGYYCLFKILKHLIPKSAINKLEVLDSDVKNWKDVLQNNFSIDIVPKEYGGKGVKVFG